MSIFFKNEQANEEIIKNVIGYFKNKIEGYKKQDKVAGREIDVENYVDEELCLNHVHGCCAHCGVKSYIEMKAGKLSTKFTFQGIDNELSHHIEMLSLGVSIAIVVFTDCYWFLDSIMNDYLNILNNGF